MSELQFKKNDVMTIDLHEMKVWEANVFLTQQIDFAPKNIKEIIIIHGYHNGRVLMHFVRHEFKNKRIKQRIHDVNQGVTHYILQ